MQYVTQDEIHTRLLLAGKKYVKLWDIYSAREMPSVKSGNLVWDIQIYHKFCRFHKLVVVK